MNLKYWKEVYHGGNTIHWSNTCAVYQADQISYKQIPAVVALDSVYQFMVMTRNHDSRSTAILRS